MLTLTLAQTRLADWSLMVHYGNEERVYEDASADGQPTVDEPWAGMGDFALGGWVGANAERIAAIVDALGEEYPHPPYPDAYPSAEAERLGEQYADDWNNDLMDRMGYLAYGLAATEVFDPAGCPGCGSAPVDGAAWCVHCDYHAPGDDAPTTTTEEVR